jgi:hypothetical protein
MFSRGVDSTFAAAVERAEPGPIDVLVHCRWLAGRMSDRTAALDRQRAEDLAGLLGRRLVGVEVAGQRFTGRFVPWTDAHGAVLAGVGLALSGAVRSVVVPGTDSFDSLVPYGSHPLVERLYSTEAVEVQHDDHLFARADKVGLLVDQRPDLLGLLVVCYAEDRADNCGRCGKCLLTMAALQAAGAPIDAVEGFPAAVDLDVVRSLGMSPLQSRLHWIAVMRALPPDGTGGELRAAIGEALRRSARPGLRRRFDDTLAWARGRRGSRHPSWRDNDRGFDWVHQARVIRALDEGRPEPALADDPPARPALRLRPPR